MDLVQQTVSFKGRLDKQCYFHYAYLCDSVFCFYEDAGLFSFLISFHFDDEGVVLKATSRGEQSVYNF